jgi:hypothetical protein
MTSDDPVATNRDSGIVFFLAAWLLYEMCSFSVQAVATSRAIVKTHKTLLPLRLKRHSIGDGGSSK